jgi:beta-N-acetylhexosaminidase
MLRTSATTLITAVAVLATGCGNGRPEPANREGPTVTSPSGTSPTVARPAVTSPAATSPDLTSPDVTTAPPLRAAPQVKLTDRQLAGQRIVYSYKGATPPAALLNVIRRGEAAGVIFFSQNIPSRAKLRAAVAAIKKANAKSPVHAPLLLMTDQEGGAVRRLSGAPTQSAKQIGLSKHPVTAATTAGTGAAANLRSVGLNVNLAPVLDVYRKKGDFADQFGRSYSNNPARVSLLGSAFIKAQQKAKVGAAAKHFPGLGTAPTKANTDLRPVTLNVSAATLRSVDEVPYASALKAGTSMVMVSWAVYPALDAHRPAGLSSTIVQQELRGRTGFHGVTVTDALEAGALRSYGSVANRGLLAARAGMDLLLFSAQSISQGVSGLNALTSALGKGTLNHGDAEAAAQRILSVRAAYS